MNELLVNAPLRVCDDLKFPDGEQGFVVAIAKKFVLICEGRGRGSEIVRITLDDALCYRRQWLIEEEGYEAVETEVCA